MAKEGVKRIGKIPLINAEKELIRLYPRIMEELGEQSLNWFLEGFRKGGGQTNESRGGWPARKHTEAGSPRAILVQSGDLFDDIEVIRATNRMVEIGTTRIPYAATHNEGLQVPARYPKNVKALSFTIDGQKIVTKYARGFKMPKREFIGESDELNDNNEDLILDYLDEIMT